MKVKSVGTFMGKILEIVKASKAIPTEVLSNSQVVGFFAVLLIVVSAAIVFGNYSVAQTQKPAETTGNLEKIDLNISNLIDEVDAKSNNLAVLESEQSARDQDFADLEDKVTATNQLRGERDDLTAKPEAQKEAERKTAEEATAQQAREEVARRTAEEAVRQPTTVPTHEGCRGSLVVSGIRSTKYFDAYEGDYNSWIEFYNAVRLEGTGVGLNGRYYRYDSITTNKATSPSYTKEQLEDSIAGGDGWPYVRHTMAADLAVNPLGTQYYLDWGEGNPWNGIYVVEDTGEGLHGWHLDIYTGFGISDMLASPIGQYVNVYTTNC